MAILIHKLKKLNAKKTVAAVTLAGVLAFAISYIPASAQGPAFNIFPISYTGELNKDLVLLDGRNASRSEGWSVSQTDHNAGVNASAGETLEFSIYYHNGAADADENVAINTIIKAFVNPSLGTSAFSHIISATIGAQNAATVSSSDPARGGDIRVNIQDSTPLNLSLVPGSIIWFPNRGFNPPPSPQVLPDTIFTSGVNIGNVRGCFQYHGFVNFKLKVNTPPVGSVSLQKTVRNVTDNSGFLKAVNADPDEIVEFKLFATNTGNVPLTDVVFKDTLPSRLTFIPGTLVSSRAIQGGDLFSSQGLFVDDMNVGQTTTITFRARVAAESQFNFGTTQLVNTGSVEDTLSTPAGPSSDTATVIVTRVAQNFALTLDKTVRNFTDNTLFADQVNADPGDIVEFKLVGKNTGDATLNDSIFNDDLPSRLSFIAGSLSVSSGTQSGDLFGTGLSTGPLSPGQSITVLFKARVADENQFPFGTTELTNVGLVRSTNPASVGPVQDIAKVVVTRQVPSVFVISVDKTVRNDSTGSSFIDQVDAQPAQRVTFKIVISPENSNQTLTNVRVSDVLPGKLIFVTGTFNVDGTVQTPGNFFSTGLNLGSMNPSSQKTITFQADVAGATQFTTAVCETLTNTVTVTADNNLSDTDTASVRVCKEAAVKAPGTPSTRPTN